MFIIFEGIASKMNEIYAYFIHILLKIEYKIDCDLN